MLKDLVVDYKKGLEDLNFIENLWVANGQMLLILLIVFLLTVFSLAGISIYVVELAKRRTIAKHGVQSEFIQKRLNHYKTSDQIYKSGKYFIILFIITIFVIVVIVKGGNSSVTKVNELEDLKIEMLATAVDDYLSGVENEPIKIKETLALNTPENKYGLYEVAFTSNGEQFKDQIVYITYLEEFPSETLIPFDGTLYKELVPTEFERTAYLSGSSSKNVGIRFYAYEDGLSIRHTVYIDDIDYIYNIKVHKKGE